MIIRTALLSMVIGTAAWAAGMEAPQAPRPSSAAEPGVIDARADAALRRMSDYIGALGSIRIETETVDEKVTIDGQKVQELQESQIAIKRPNQMRVDRVSPNGHAVLRYDGSQLSVYNVDKNIYATMPAPNSLDAAIDVARARLGIDAPAGDLILSRPYDELVRGIKVGRYIGLEPVDGAMAHHLAFTADDVDWQLWIKDGPEPVPLRYVITSKDMQSAPQFTLEIRKWQPNPAIAADTFSFVPPAGATRVALKAPAPGGPSNRGR